VSETPSTGLVHDYLLVMRGAERTFEAIAECFPDAPIYTLLYDEERTNRAFASRSVSTSYLQRLGIRQAGFRSMLPLFPHAAGRLVDRDHDLVVSSSSAFAHGIRLSSSTTHVCYCHSPFRYAWFEEARALEEAPRFARPLLRLTLRRIRSWDQVAATRVTHYIANSKLTQERIRRFWGRESTVIHPPVEIERFSRGTPEDFLLVVGELVPHKRVDSALEAARRAGRPIKVVGTGPELSKLRARYGGGAEFLGRVGDQELNELYARTQALVVPGTEEFGIAAVEAQAAGRPVVAADAGGVRETVVHGETGLLVTSGDTNALADALRTTDFESFSSQRIQQQAARFSTAEFKRRLGAELERIAPGHLPPEAELKREGPLLSGEEVG
jgi:glycosyltransferase involved in cell wall biosynthesis